MVLPGNPTSGILHKHRPQDGEDKSKLHSCSVFAFLQVFQIAYRVELK